MQLARRRSFRGCTRDLRGVGNGHTILVVLLTFLAVAPTGHDGIEKAPSGLDDHQGISFDRWLDLFLDYAIGLAMAHRRDEAYQVCEAAKDSTAFQTPEHGFIIHVAWTGGWSYRFSCSSNSSSVRHLYQ